MMKKIKFSDQIKRLKHFTKIDGNTWLVQSNPKSLCEAYYVTVLQNAIVMYGDYDGVIVKPHECKRENLIRWMANATTLSYFCEKVKHGNQYHQVVTWDEDLAKKQFAEYLLDREVEIKDKWNDIDETVTITQFDVNIIKKILYEGYSHYHYENRGKARMKFYEMIKDTMEFETPESFINSLHKMGHESGFDVDGDEYDAGETYTHQIKWQHQCLLWWARHVMETEYKGDEK